jgi:prepilin-type N-terminal cleavage/methylation domain-containing protein
MTPTSRARAPVALKAGFSLMEMLFTLAIMALTAAMVVPGIQKTLANNADRSEIFHFQRLALDLRATAYHTERTLIVVDTGQFKDDGDPETDPRPAEIKLDDGWSYRLSGPFTISPRGLCDVVTADLSYRGRPRDRLTGTTDCHFTSAKLS